MRRSNNKLREGRAIVLGYSTGEHQKMLDLSPPPLVNKKT